MNLLKPRKVINLTNPITPISGKEALEYCLANEGQGGRMVKLPTTCTSFISKAGIFFRWSAYTITFLLSAGITYVCLYGYPPILRHTELQFIESRVEEVAASVSAIEDKTDLSKSRFERIDKRIEKLEAKK
jgi:hypothetical protein